MILPTTTQSPQFGKLKVRLISQMPDQVELLKSAIHWRSVPPPLIGSAGGMEDVVTGESTMLLAGL